MHSRRRTALGLASIFSLVAVQAGCGSSDDASSPSSTMTPSNDGGTGAQSDADAATTAQGGTTINGKIVWQSINVKGVTVVIDGKTATTADNGSFSIPNVQVPYTVHVVVPKELVVPNGPPAKAAHSSTIVGLTTASPVLEVAAVTNSVVGRVQGTILGGTADAKSTYMVTAGAPFTAYGYQSGDLGGGTSNISPKAYKISQTWNAGETQQIVHVAAVEFKYPEGLDAFEGIPTTYSSTAKSLVGLTAGGTAEGNLGTFAAVTTKNVSGTFTVPAGYTVSRHLLELLGNGGGSVSFNQELHTTSFAYPAPDDAAAFPKIRVGATATTGVPGEYAGASVDVTPGTSNISVTLPRGPAIEKPANGAAGVKAGDTLSWTNAGDACLYRVRLDSASDTAPELDLRTTATSVTIPDLAAYGAGLAASTTYSFSVQCNVLDGASKASMDDDAVLGGAPSSAYAQGPLRNIVTQ